MKSARFKVVTFILGLLLFGFILGLIFHEFKSYNFHSVTAYLQSIPLINVAQAFGLTVAAYMVLTGYDLLAFRYIGHPLSFRRVVSASFIGYAFSHNLGFTMLTGAPVRYRLYSAWGLSGFDVARVVAFCVLTFFLGFLIVGGCVFLFEPTAMPAAITERFPSLQPLGVFCLLVVLCYLLWSWYEHKPLRIRQWEIPIPSLKLSIPQCFISSLEWIVTGSILFVLLPSHPQLSYSWFLGIFLLAQMAGLISQVPGGLGVFDTVIVLGMSPPMDEAKVIGALLAYRFMFYLLPLILASLLLGVHEIHLKKKEIIDFFKRKKSSLTD